MSQVVKLKRTAVEGKVPTTSNIELGELAINTYDGRIFFEKDNGTATIQQVITTNSQTTGSLNILGNVTASYFIGNGSQLTNLPAVDVSQVATVTSSFDNQSSISVSHNFNSKNVLVSVYQSNDTQIIPQSVTLTNNNSVDVVLSGNHSGYVVVAKGGHVVSGSTDWTNVSNKPSGIISGSTQITNLTTYAINVSGNSTYTITHNLNEEYPIVQAWNTTTKRQELPSIIESTSVNALDVTFSSTFLGRIIVKK
jgi:hypothetical protein